jgi:hypothetical protein
MFSREQLKLFSTECNGHLREVSHRCRATRREFTPEGADEFIIHRASLIHRVSIITQSEIGILRSIP